MPIGLAVAVAGAAGALARYPLDFYAGDHMEPHHQVYITFAINMAGSLAPGPADRRASTRRRPGRARRRLPRRVHDVLDTDGPDVPRVLERQVHPRADALAEQRRARRVRGVGGRRGGPQHGAGIGPRGHPNRSNPPSERGSGAVLRRTGEGRVPCTRHPPSTHLTNGTSHERSWGRVHGLDFSGEGEWPGLNTPSRPGHRLSAAADAAFYA